MGKTDPQKKEKQEDNKEAKKKKKKEKDVPLVFVNKNPDKETYVKEENEDKQDDKPQETKVCSLALPLREGRGD
jgi:hypothetical protein